MHLPITSFTIKSILFVFLISFLSCRKSKIEIPEVLPPVVVDPTPTPPPPVQSAPFIEVGTGSGNLIVDGNAIDLSKIKLILVKAGNYQTILIKNISGTAEAPILVKNNGLVNISTSMNTDNVNHLKIAGDYISNIQYGFNFENIPYRAIILLNKANGVTLKNISFKNVVDYSISSNTASLAYNGTENTRTEGLKILNCSFDNSGQINFGGNLDKSTGKDIGFYKDVEIAYNSFKNTNWGEVCIFSNVQDYDIHHNIVNNINMTSNKHNGVFHMQGNGKFHDNKLTNYQGNAIRMWLFSRGNTPATNEIYNNICYNTRKYSGFEIQSFDNLIYPGKSTYANAKVYNNTVGQMNTSKDWEGQLLDLYSIPGTIEYYNNLGFNLTTTSGKGISNMIDFQGNGKVIKDENNRYFTSQANAVANVTTFPSLIPEVGAPAQ